MIWTTVFSLLSGLPGILGDYFKRKQEIEKTRIDASLQVQLANAQLQSQMAESEANLQITALNSTSSLFKEKTFWFLSIPMVVSIILPGYAETMWNNLNIVPEFYKTLYCGMVCAIWGLPRAMEWLDRSVDSRRAYKLAKIDRKSYYEALRKTKGVVTDQDVKEMEPVFDEIDSKG